MSKQTAVEWLVEQVIKEKGLIDLDIQAAKAMEKEQMREVALQGVTKSPVFRKIFEQQFEKYFNETYKGGEKSPPTTNNQ